MMMKKSALLGLLAAGLVVLGPAPPSQAAHHWRGGVFVRTGPW
jgi:hypothetical protein